MTIYFDKQETALTRVTKVVAVFLGVFFVFYGGMAALFGVGPGGGLGFPMRLLGLFVVFVGVIFILPNRLLDRFKWIFFLAATLVITASVIMLFSMIFADHSMNAGYTVYGTILVLSLAAVASFWAYKMGR